MQMPAIARLPRIHENLAKLWEEIKILTKPQAVELSLEPEQSSGEPLLAKLNIFSRPSTLRVVFLHEYNAQNSAWVRPPHRGINALQKAFPDRLTTSGGECRPGGGCRADPGAGSP